MLKQASHIEPVIVVYTSWRVIDAEIQTHTHTQNTHIHNTHTYTTQTHIHNTHTYTTHTQTHIHNTERERDEEEEEEEMAEPMRHFKCKHFRSGSRSLMNRPDVVIAEHVPVPFHQPLTHQDA